MNTLKEWSSLRKNYQEKLLRPYTTGGRNMQRDVKEELSIQELSELRLRKAQELDRFREKLALSKESMRVMVKPAIGIEYSEKVDLSSRLFSISRSPKSEVPTSRFGGSKNLEEELLESEEREDIVDELSYSETNPMESLQNSSQFTLELLNSKQSDTFVLKSSYLDFKVGLFWYLIHPIIQDFNRKLEFEGIAGQIEVKPPAVFENLSLNPPNDTYREEQDKKDDVTFMEEVNKDLQDSEHKNLEYDLDYDKHSESVERKSASAGKESEKLARSENESNEEEKYQDQMECDQKGPLTEIIESEHLENQYNVATFEISENFAPDSLEKRFEIRCEDQENKFEQMSQEIKNYEEYSEYFEEEKASSHLTKRSEIVQSDNKSEHFSEPTHLEQQPREIVEQTNEIDNQHFKSDDLEAKSNPKSDQPSQHSQMNSPKSSNLSLRKEKDLSPAGSSPQEDPEDSDVLKENPMASVHSDSRSDYPIEETSELSIQQLPQFFPIEEAINFPLLVEEPEKPELPVFSEENVQSLAQALENASIAALATDLCRSFYALKRRYIEKKQKAERLNLALANYEYGLLRRSYTGWSLHTLYTIKRVLAFSAKANDFRARWDSIHLFRVFSAFRFICKAHNRWIEQIRSEFSYRRAVRALRAWRVQARHARVVHYMQYKRQKRLLQQWLVYAHDRRTRLIHGYLAWYTRLTKKTLRAIVIFRHNAIHARGLLGVARAHCRQKKLQKIFLRWKNVREIVRANYVPLKIATTKTLTMRQGRLLERSSFDIHINQNAF